jgi:hypothetical protein
MTACEICWTEASHRAAMSGGMTADHYHKRSGMTLHTYPQVEQGTPAWHELRRGIVTASVVGKLITPTLKVADNDVSRGITATLAAERITGWTEDTPMNSDMWRGVE